MMKKSSVDKEGIEEDRIEVQLMEEHKEETSSDCDSIVEGLIGCTTTTTTTSCTRKNNEHVLEQGARFSESVLWDMMRRFYADQGVDAWSLGIVPHFITCNAFIARSYAKILQSYLSDLHAKGAVDPSEPVYIVELGVGSGKFSFLLLKALVERMEAMYGDDPPVRFKYVLTDFCETPFAFWRKHPALQRYLNAGLLDFAKFDACQDDAIRLEMCGSVVRNMANPPIVVANYLFDTLPADAYRVKDGVLSHGLLTVKTATVERDRTDPAILNRFSPHWEWDPVSLAGRSERSKDQQDEQAQQQQEQRQNNPESTPDETDSICHEILAWYAAHFGKTDASFLLPTQSLRCLDRLRSLSRTGRLMVLSGDKGQSTTISLRQNGLCDPHIAVHGSFSLMVNYHAIGLWFQAHGGFALHCPLEDASLKVSAFVIETPSPVDSPLDTTSWNCFGEAAPALTRPFAGLRLAFAETVGDFGPDHFFQLQQRELADCAASQDESLVRAVVALLQLSDWDADLVFKYREVLLNNLGVCNVRLLNDLRRGMERAWENYFFLEREKDFAFELGRFYYGLQEYQRALVFYSKSSDLVGKHHVTEHNIGLCHASLGNRQAALDRFDSCLRLNPTYVKASEQRAKLLPRSPCLTPTRRDLIEKERIAKSPQNSRHVRISFDPEVIERAKTPQASTPLSRCSTVRDISRGEELL
ncbi:Hsp70-Hsp90 organizing protein 1 [Hondaea fermentalgiana]|uniref:Hsp70-Hsp90 organizing protein 1 n=1 Tax=Hondaea fermentalgiana TaxID=2315210 RepID=A0A2R5GKN6_9STRA|nr:Hsp70-Hsp90 organizing protein 1 [Hondaea fermentalgiana]|eukprot:GBG28841.1 Hsp70-Hsp90 organizing protein 1 [Hondaea fermentalgiana]